MFDLRVINSVLNQMEEERGIKRERMLDAIEQALATAYKKEFGKRGQIIKADFDIATGTTSFNQIKIVVDENMVGSEGKPDQTEAKASSAFEGKNFNQESRPEFDEEKHILIKNAKLIKKDVVLDRKSVV